MRSVEYTTHLEIFAIVDIALLTGNCICAIQNVIFKCEYNFIILSGVKVAFLPTNRNNARVLRKINRNVTAFSIKLEDIYNVEP